MVEILVRTAEQWDNLKKKNPKKYWNELCKSIDRAETKAMD